MTGAILKVMVLGLVRDRGAFAMAFLLPPLIFVIFAAIFSGTSGDEMRLKVALFNAVGSQQSQTLEEALREEPTLRLHETAFESEAAVRAAVLSGDADVGLVVRGDLLGESDEAPILVVADAGRSMTGPILAGQVQRLIARNLPAVAMQRSLPAVEELAGGLSAEQRARLDAGLSAMEEGEDKDRDAGTSLVSIETLTGRSGGVTVSYYAGAVAIMFLLFSAMQGAATLIEERSSGIIDRVAVGPAGTDVIVLAKFLFLSIQGILQVSLIFLVAWLAYGVNVPGSFVPWAFTTVLAAAAAAGLALAMASACVSRQQANTISSFLVLVASAVGGSMVPRFMMPPWLQDLGWFTPNAWAIEAYQGALWRGAPLTALLPSFWPLAVAALLGLAAALALSRYRLKIG
ncbi:ABC transporter permease [Hoeflea prorocentri]|uniref:ABC transporter permease n=1 Tax=Hoeflea prorocentri TaxID=1922333 RepID=A0A9X3ZGT5_9HYPH|nr:ABC transporter permease [Hoeflea prorocentri]MCY6380564.1 ABC transporter permease [Hoeflea prorocentri]MDA5398364.1 ABC transporter permease [Hoeflea prorocentri]